jgi:beta-galactosidase
MRILISLLFSFIVFFSSAFGRDVKSFNNDWKFKKGPFSTDPILFSASFDERWQDVTIPHTWNAIDMQNDKNNFYAGEAYYKKIYRPDAALKDKRIFLRFEGVGAVAEVYVNNSFAGNHKGGYSAFAIELTKLLKYGEDNEILVKVDNSSRPDVVPVNHTLFGVYGGIYRPVDLIVTEKVNIAVTDYASPGIYISQENVSSKSADVKLKIKLENKNSQAKNIQLNTTIYDMQGKVVQSVKQPIQVLPQGRQFFEQAFHIKNPHLWQGLEDPYLYKVETELIENGKTIDKVFQPLGLRHFELKAEDGMYLNGKKVPMYGVCRHQDWWKLGSALTNENHDTDLSIIKEIGATTIRLAHYQQSEYFYSKCDSIGFMVWAEIPYVNRVTTKEADNAKQQMVELIRQNYNHPSIYIWGLHNEVYSPNDYTVALTTELNDLAKTEDPYRYTVSVSGYNTVDRPTNLNADVQGINHYFGWYNGKIGDIEKWVTKMEKDFPGYKVMFSEYGAEANIYHQQEVVGDVGDCCGFNKRYNETFATRFHEIQWGVISKHPYLLASYIWNTFDFATPASSQGGVEARNMKGLVTFDRKVKKDPFYWYKANWSKEPVLYLTQRRVVDRVNEITPVTVYSNIGVPQLFVNGREVTSYKEGTTAVHYIFENVKLQEGKNDIEVRGVREGKNYQDKIEWNYSENNKNKSDINQPVENTNEHIGL